MSTLFPFFRLLGKDSQNHNPLFTMKKILLPIALTLCTLLQAQTAYKVDINMSNRQEAEVLEPGYTPWATLGEALQLDNITVTLRSGSTLRNGWNKTLITSKEVNSRLTCDGCTLDPSASCGSFELVIKGFSAGQHSIQTIHNSWDDKTRFAVYPITISLNGNVVHRSVAPTQQVVSAQDATICMTTFTVNGPDDETVITFSTSEDDAPDASGKTSFFRAPLLNGFMIDMENTTMQAKLPTPADFDNHADGDDGTITLSWSPANSDITAHQLFIGTDSVSVAQADNTSSLYVGQKAAADTIHTLNDVYSMNTYYWRVDELSPDGTVTKGAVWQFRPRHLAFPGAEGYGRFASGGRGGVVYHVTNLSNDNTPGSLRYGLVSMRGPRTIVFDVSGLIVMDLTSMFATPYVTIAAQTAPGKGICLKYSNLNIGSESICRFLRARRGYGITGNAMGMAGANHAIVDHTTASWGTDETFSSRGAHNITFQYSMIAEALGIADHQNYSEGTNHGYAATIGGDVGTFSHNLLVDCYGRNWSLGGGLDGSGFYAGRLDIFNNVVYNWRSRTTDGGAHEVNFVGNYYKAGPATSQNTIFNLQLEGTGQGTQSAYLKNNIYDRSNGTIDIDASSMYRMSRSGDQVVDWTYFVDEPFFPSYATIDSPKDAYKKVLSSVGAEFPVKDDNDKRMIHETLNRTYTYTGSRSNIKGQIDHENDCGGFEVYPEEQRAANYDSDQDGMPDWWEKLTGTDPQVADNNGDPDRDGYTNLEDFLNFLADVHVIIAPGKSETITLSSFFAGFTASPQYTVTGSANGITTNIDNGSLTVSAAETASGVSLMKLTVTDSENTSMTRQLGIAVTDDTTTSIRQSLTDETTLRSYRVITLDGRLVKHGKANGGTLRNLPLSAIPSGVYILETTDTTGQKHSCKIIK